PCLRLRRTRVHGYAECYNAKISAHRHLLSFHSVHGLALAASGSTIPLKGRAGLPRRPQAGRDSSDMRQFVAGMRAVPPGMFARHRESRGPKPLRGEMNNLEYRAIPWQGRDMFPRRVAPALGLTRTRRTRFLRPGGSDCESHPQESPPSPAQTSRAPLRLDSG